MNKAQSASKLFKKNWKKKMLNVQGQKRHSTAPQKTIKNKGVIKKTKKVRYNLGLCDCLHP